MRILLTLLAIAGSLWADAQSKYTISGFVRDSATGETVIGASVSAGEGRSVSSNQYGYYSLTLEAGTYTLSVSHVSFFTDSRSIRLTGPTPLNIDLKSKSAAMNEVIVYSKRRDANVRNAQMGKVDLSIAQIKSVPAFLGEVDILKTIQLLPGVRNAGEGNAGFYVRGGGPDQNLILLDDAVVYNTGHLFGFFSIFNSDAIKNVSLIKGGMPAQYGGRLSSVLDVAMKDGNSQQFTGEGGIGLIASRLSLQGPIVKDKASFMVSGRRTYVDVLTKPFVSKTSTARGSGYYFYDLNAKVNWRFSPKDRLYLSGYFGRDVFRFVNTGRSFSADIPWGNSTATLRWNHVFGPKLFSNTTLVYNDYHFEFGATQNDFRVGLYSGIRDGNLKVDFDYYPAPQHKLKFGAQSTYHKFIPNLVSGSQDSTRFSPSNAELKYALENALYFQDDWDISDKVKINAGLRWTQFSQLGPYKKFERDADGNKLDSTVYGRNEIVKAYHGFEPRLTARYQVNASTSIKASVTRNLQYIHLVSNSGTTLPTDLWLPSSYRTKPQVLWQYSAGYFRNYNDNTWETSVEVYYKDMKQQIEFEEGYQPNVGDPEEHFVFGSGSSYGAEFFVNKVRGRLTGWIGYTLSWTWRKFPDLNGGERFPAKYDRRHDLSVVATYELSPKWKFGGVFVFGTGNTTSLPERFYIINGVLTQEYSKVNQYRLKPYHRMDLSATWTPKPFKTGRYKSHWVFSIYNVYSRLNPYFIYFDQQGSPLTNDLKVQAKQVSLFPIIPAVTWNFKF
ncbi:TonB-dependent receptor [Flaviaesturariibacter amylovorans]|uniref:TonB-dependent receptor n=1 Tax=Flaviaesturariibacter amylovorans TaxID=1084520 RepID=A0ABP8GWB6_9BACT